MKNRLRTVISKPPTKPFEIVTCTFSDKLFRNSCIQYVDSSICRCVILSLRRMQTLFGPQLESARILGDPGMASQMQQYSIRLIFYVVLYYVFNYAFNIQLIFNIQRVIQYSTSHSTFNYSFYIQFLIHPFNYLFNNFNHLFNIQL